MCTWKGDVFYDYFLWLNNEILSEIFNLLGIGWWKRVWGIIDEIFLYFHPNLDEFRKRENNFGIRGELNSVESCIQISLKFFLLHHLIKLWISIKRRLKLQKFLFLSIVWIKHLLPYFPWPVIDYSKHHLDKPNFRLTSNRT